jgi:Oxidoreductase molybdopterin binding domain
MRQPGAGARDARANGGRAGIRGFALADDAPGTAGVPGPRDERSGDPGGPPPRGGRADADVAGPTGPIRAAEDRPDRLPPGQFVQASMPVLHGFHALPRTEIIADFHCVTKFSVLGVTWLGVPAAAVLSAVPPSGRATHVMVWAEFGYGANLPLDAFGASDTLLATHRDGKELTPDQGYPVRLVIPTRYGWKNVKWVRAIEYMIGDRRGFWEERGYHNNADPWREQRYSYQERPGEGPAL